MSLNSFITLGRSGLRVSPFCLGSMIFGEDLGWGASVVDSEAIIAVYLERGGNFIDTANIYTNRHSEKIIGDFFAQKKGSRDRVVIGTKFCCSLFEGDPNGGGAGRKALIQQCEASLRRLQTDYIDIYWLHIWDRIAPIEETLRGLDDLVASGKVRYIGFSDLPAWKVSEAQRATMIPVPTGVQVWLATAGPASSQSAITADSERRPPASWRLLQLHVVRAIDGLRLRRECSRFH
jgi:aryl-alcohol dehydrogenase-like predicted oxidoreductase